MSVQYCTKCGKQLSEKARFCPGCGHPIEDTGDIPSEQGIDNEHENEVLEEGTASSGEDVLTETETDPIQDNGIYSTDNEAHDTASVPSQKVVANDLDTSSKIRRIVMNPILTLCAAAVALAMLIGVIVLFVHTVSTPNLVGQYEMISMQQVGKEDMTESAVQAAKQAGLSIPNVVISPDNSGCLTINGNLNTFTVSNKKGVCYTGSDEFYYSYDKGILTLYIGDITMVFKKIE